MKTIQKLELFAGAATLTTALLSFFIIHLPLMRRFSNETSSIKEFLIGPFIIFILPVFLTVIGAYIHAVRRSITGFIIILVFGGLLVFSHAVGFLIGTSFNGHVLLGVSPGIFAALTIIFALFSLQIKGTSLKYDEHY